MRQFAWLVAGILMAPVGAPAQWKIPWDYAGPRGPSHWAALDPAYAACGGKEQSPVDIRAAVKADLPPIRFEYQSAPLRYLIDNGKTIRVNYHAPQSGGFLVVGEERYRLTQFHFHRPSEEYIDGKPFDMVVHLMHESGGGKLAGVAVLLKAGKQNLTVRQLWAHMPKTESKEREIPGTEINPAGLLPSDTAYYTYMGSLTAPPCDEGVTWFVLKTPVEISRSQIDAFARLYPHDVRPPQPLNGRIVRESR